MRIDVDISAEEPDEDEVVADRLVPLKNSLNLLKTNLRDLMGALRHIRTRESRNMATVQTIEERIMKFSYFEVILVTIMSIGGVFVLKTYFKNHLKKGSA